MRRDDGDPARRLSFWVSETSATRDKRRKVFSRRNRTFWALAPIILTSQLRVMTSLLRTQQSYIVVVCVCCDIFKDSEHVICEAFFRIYTHKLGCVLGND